jgi:hypothetical protein
VREKGGQKGVFSLASAREMVPLGGGCGAAGHLLLERVDEVICQLLCLRRCVRVVCGSSRVGRVCRVSCIVCVSCIVRS